jgi:hypothetical protein
MVSELKVFNYAGYLEAIFPEKTGFAHQKIRFLEIHDPCWPRNELFQNAILLHDNASKEGTDARESVEDGYPAGSRDFAKNMRDPSNFVMRFFPNLETLALISDERDAEYGGLNSPKLLERCTKDLEAWYAKEKELSLLAKAPKIHFRYESVSLLRNKSSLSSYWNLETKT